jgi:hypothetical protein
MVVRAADREQGTRLDAGAVLTCASGHLLPWHGRRGSNTQGQRPTAVDVNGLCARG